MYKKSHRRRRKKKLNKNFAENSRNKNWWRFSLVIVFFLKKYHRRKVALCKFHAVVLVEKWEKFLRYFADFLMKSRTVKERHLEERQHKLFSGQIWLFFFCFNFNWNSSRQTSSFWLVRLVFFKFSSLRPTTNENRKNPQPKNPQWNSSNLHKISTHKT